MKAHYNTLCHDFCQQCEIQERKQLEHQCHVGINVGKLVLATIREHDSDSSFERRVATCCDMGISLGTKNHSRVFVPKLRDSLHEVTKAALAKSLTEVCVATGRPPPFATLADKATLNHETGQMHGGIVMLEGEMVPLFLSVLPAPDATGAGVAQLQMSVLQGGEPFNFTMDHLRESWTCMAMDGQYQSEDQGHAAGLAGYSRDGIVLI
jgi:hypothetical protein